MNESIEVHQEGSPAVEKVEQTALGTSTYEKAEIVHRFADANSWFHPLLVILAVVAIIGIALFVRRSPKKE